MEAILISFCHLVMINDARGALITYDQISGVVVVVVVVRDVLVMSMRIDTEQILVGYRGKKGILCLPSLERFLLRVVIKPEFDLVVLFQISHYLIAVRFSNSCFAIG